MADPLLIFGASGQVGLALVKHAAAAGFVPVAFGSADGDITDPGRLLEIARKYPDAPVINAAAYTAVDKAESDAESAFAVNATGPAYLAAAFGLNRPVLHFSTDYVFDGCGSMPYRAEAETCPLGVYGMSKRVGEAAILATAHGTVIRTAWVFADTGNNFLKTMLRVGRERGHLRVVADQIGSPTHADDIARGALSLLSAQLAGNMHAAPGVYHLTAKGSTSWHGFANEIFKALAAQTGEHVVVDAISTAEYPTPAQRPAYSVLDCSKVDLIPGVERQEWQSRVAPTVARILANTIGTPS